MLRGPRETGLHFDWARGRGHRKFHHQQNTEKQRHLCQVDTAGGSEERTFGPKKAYVEVSRYNCICRF